MKGHLPDSVWGKQPAPLCICSYSLPVCVCVCAWRGGGVVVFPSKATPPLLEPCSLQFPPGRRRPSCSQAGGMAFRQGPLPGRAPSIPTWRPSGAPERGGGERVRAPPCSTARRTGRAGLGGPRGRPALPPRTWLFSPPPAQGTFWPPAKQQPFQPPPEARPPPRRPPRPSRRRRRVTRRDPASPFPSPEETPSFPPSPSAPIHSRAAAGGLHLLQPARGGGALRPARLPGGRSLPFPRGGRSPHPRPPLCPGRPASGAAPGDMPQSAPPLPLPPRARDSPPRRCARCLRPAPSAKTSFP